MFASTFSAGARRVRECRDIERASSAKRSKTANKINQPTTHTKIQLTICSYSRRLSKGYSSENEYNYAERGINTCTGYPCLVVSPARQRDAPLFAPLLPPAAGAAAAFGLLSTDWNGFRPAVEGVATAAPPRASPFILLRCIRTVPPSRYKRNTSSCCCCCKGSATSRHKGTKSPLWL